ncbi:MAG: DUF2202 domain-containing protein [Pseudolysinimonas sp.]
MATNKRPIVIASISAGAVIVAGAIVFAAFAYAPTPPVAVSGSPSAVGEPTPSAAAIAPTAVPYDTAARMLYIIEEEKLAHDVYVALGATWGANIFLNILESETTHQGLLVPLLDARGLVDPRSTEVGVFTDPTLQALYNDLIARGNVSFDEAIQVGILIEEKDITDLADAIAAEDEADVISVYERLSAGSENHLSSFQRQA